MKISSHTRNVLESARFVIASGHWCKHAFARDADEIAVNPEDASAISFDLETAAYEAARALGYGARKAERALDILHTISGKTPMCLNDESGNRRPILRVIDEALACA